MDKDMGGWTEGWIDRQACCRMPMVQPGFCTIASLTSPSCLLPQFPQLANALLRGG